MKNKLINFIVCFFMASSCLFAKEVSSSKNSINAKTTPKSEKLTLVDVLNLALQNNPKIKEAWLNVDVSNYSYRSHLSNALPTITGEVSYSNNRSKYDDERGSVKSEGITPSVGISYLLFDFGGRTADILNFKHKLNAVKFETNEFIQSFIFQVIEAYYNLFSSLANEKAAKETEMSSYEAFKAASVRYKIGLAPLTDKLQAETSYMQAKLTRERVENNVKIKRAELNYLLNMSPLNELDLEIPFLNITKDDFQRNVADLIDVGLKNRPDLKAYYETKRAKKAELYNNATKWLPSVSLNGSYGHTNDIRKNSKNDRDNYNVGVTASMPFFTGGYVYSNVARSKSELNIINQQIRDLEKSIELDIWSTYQNFMTAKRTYVTSETLLKSALETEKTMLGRYKNGKSSMLDLLNTQSDLAAARYESITAQHNWFISRANLLRAIGQMSVEELQALNDATELDEKNRNIAYNNNYGIQNENN